MSSSQNGIHDFLHLPYPRTLGGFKQGLVSANQYFDEGPVSGELATGLRDVYLQLCRVGEAGHDDIDLMPASHLSVLVCMRVAMAASVDVYKKKDGCVDPCFLAEKLAGVVVPEEQALHTRFDSDCAVSLFERLANFMGAYYYGQMPYANVDEYVTLVSSFFPGGGSFGFVDAEGQTSTEWSEYVETIHTNVLGRIVLKIDKDNARSISYSSKEVVKLPWPDMEELSPEILSEATDFNNCLKLGRKVDPTYISELDESTAVFKEGKLEVYPEGIPKGLEEWFLSSDFFDVCARRCGVPDTVLTQPRWKSKSANILQAQSVSDALPEVKKEMYSKIVGSVTGVLSHISQDICNNCMFVATGEVVLHMYKAVDYPLEYELDKEKISDIVARASRMAVENKWEIDDLHTNVSLYAGPIKRKACETDRLSKRQCTGNVSDLVSLPSMEELTGDNNLIFGDVDFESSSVLAIGQTEFDPNRFVYRNNVASVVNSPNAPQVMKMKALLKVLNDPENQCLAIHGADIDVRRALLSQTYHALQLFLGVTGMTKFSEFSQQLPKHQRVKEEHYEKLLECLSAPISGESMYWLVMNCRKGNGWSYGVDLRVSLRVFLMPA